MFEMSVDASELFSGEGLSSTGKKVFGVVDELPVTGILCFDGVVDDEGDVKEEVELELAGERIVGGVVGEGEDFHEARNGVREEEEGIGGWWSRKKAVLHVVERESAPVGRVVVADEVVEELGLLQDPLAECLVDFVVVEADERGSWRDRE